MDKRIDEATGRTLLTVLAVWAAVIAGAALDDTFAKFGPRDVAMFAAGVALYALATYRIDRDVHAFIQNFSRGVIVMSAIFSLAAFAAASMRHVPALAVFVAPFAAVATAAAVEKLTTRPTKARAKSPGVTRAAI
jgi:hypothetical protein